MNKTRLGLVLIALSAFLVFTAAPQSSVGATPGELVVASGVFPVTLDPLIATDQDTLNVVEQIIEPLVWNNYQTHKLEPYLAASWKVVSPTVWEFKLRPGVKFTDGEELTADVVRYNWQRLTDPQRKSPNTYLAQGITDVQVVDKDTARIVTDKPSPVLLLQLSMWPMVPMTYVQQHGDAYFAAHPVGTGPYTLAEDIPGQRVVLQANPTYWRGRPSLQRVTFLGIPEQATRMAALQTKAADLVTLVGIDDAPRLQQAGFAVVPEPSNRNMFILLDTLHGGPLADKRVRQAFNYAIDKASTIKYVLKGYGAILDGQLLTASTVGYNPNLKAYPYDPTKAKQLLAQAGYGNGLRVTFYTSSGHYQADEQISTAITGQLQNIGVTVDLETLDWGTFLLKLRAKQLGPMALQGLIPPPDANFMYLNQECGQVNSYYCNKPFDSLVNAAGTELDTAKRRQLYWQAAAIQYDDPPVIFLWQQVDLYGTSSRVQRWRPRPDEVIDLWGVTASGS